MNVDLSELAKFCTDFREEIAAWVEWAKANAPHSAAAMIETSENLLAYYEKSTNKEE